MHVEREHWRRPRACPSAGSAAGRRAGASARTSAALGRPALVPTNHPPLPADLSPSVAGARAGSRPPDAASRAVAVAMQAEPGGEYTKALPVLSAAVGPRRARSPTTRCTTPESRRTSPRTRAEARADIPNAVRAAAHRLSQEAVRIGRGGGR